MNPEYPFQPQQPQQPQPSVPGQYAVPGVTPQPYPQTGYMPPSSANLPPVQRAPHASKLWVILAVIFILTTLAAAAFGVWAYLNYVDHKENVDTKVSAAVAVAVKDQADKDAANFLEKEKQPNRQFVGPDDYGRLSFDYPKTWSAYVSKDAVEGDTFEAYFHPGVVPVISAKQQFALHVTIEDKDYDKEIESYKSAVSKGDLKSSSVKAEDVNGTRLDGMFSKDVRGSAVIFKIRDKTVMIRTDADTFKGDFDALVQTITFNK